MLDFMLRFKYIIVLNIVTLLYFICEQFCICTDVGKIHFIQGNLILSHTGVLK
jgi:hypothetical protein